MKTICTLILVLLCSQATHAQCVAGYSKATLNWDWLDYFVWSGTYDDNYLTSAAQANTQQFSFGTNRLTIDAQNGKFSLLGENTLHTGHSGSYANDGADVQYTVSVTNGAALTLTFSQEVRNLQFSIYDLDSRQRVNVTAFNATNVAKMVRLGLATTNSPVTIANNNSTNAQATAPNLTFTNSDNKGTVNIEVEGPVNKVVLNFTVATGDFWLSDMSACTPGNFPNDYYQVSRPWNGQPGYILHAFDNEVYAVDPDNGVSKNLFTDNTVPGNGNINSMAYDPYNKFLYYVYSFTDRGQRPGGSKVLRKYDFNTETSSTVLGNITNLGIPVTSLFGVEAGGAAFYNGCLYLGIQATDNDNESGREVVIWRIEFNSAHVPVRASQVFALPADNGNGRLLHDWGDFVINNGVLYDFDNTGNIYRYNLLTGAAIIDNNPSLTPGQTAVNWEGQLYQLNSFFLPYVAVYNPQSSSFNNIQLITTSPMFNAWAPPAMSDAAEAFRPKCDFGDAPSSYTSSSTGPAAHERDLNLRLGAAYDAEWDPSTASADDGIDEDGIGAAPALNVNGTLTYTLNNISVYNNTGTDATLTAWLDYNFNGVFEAGEGRTLTVPGRANQQFVTLSWNNINVPTTSAIRTYLRLRVTSASNGMLLSNMNGWFSNGEVEDYPVVIGIVLPLNNSSTTPSISDLNNDTRIWPNPAKEHAVVKLNSLYKTKAVIQIVDKFGRQVKQYSRDVTKGTNQLAITNLGSLCAGVYIVRVFINNSITTTQLLISRQ